MIQYVNDFSYDLCDRTGIRDRCAIPFLVHVNSVFLRLSEGQVSRNKFVCIGRYAYARVSQKVASIFYIFYPP